ncbi:MAG: hypothetical protein AB7I13_00335 [Vicinamibacterales bacterium]
MRDEKGIAPAAISAGNEAANERGAKVKHLLPGRERDAEVARLEAEDSEPKPSRRRAAKEE